jgi:hypothetical protein
VAVAREKGLATKDFCNYTYGMEKRMGRPPLDPADAKSQVFQIRLTGAERGSYEAAAKRSGKTLTAWIRDRLNRAAKRA